MKRLAVLAMLLVLPMAAFGNPPLDDDDKGRRSVGSGGGPAPPSFTRTEVGTVFENDGLASNSIPNVTASAGNTLVLGLVWTVAPLSASIPLSIEWGSEAFESVTSTGLSDDIRSGMYYLDCTTTGTHNIVISFPVPAPPTAFMAFATKFTGLQVPSLDLNTPDSNTGAGEGAISFEPGGFSASAAVWEVAVGGVELLADPVGAWESAYLQGQRTGGAALNPGTISEGYRVDADAANGGCSYTFSAPPSFSAISGAAFLIAP